MDIEILTRPFPLCIYGLSDIATSKDYVGTAFKLSGRMWELIKTHNIKNKGKNIWVYGLNDHVFAGVELEQTLDDNFGLDRMEIILEKFARYKHVGSYHLIKQTGQSMQSELAKQGYSIILPYIEIYGHWTSDESKLETELIMSLK